MKIAVIGAGSWGTAVANLLAAAGRDVVLWGRDKVIVNDLNRLHENPGYLVGIKLSSALTALDDIEKAVKGRDVIAVALPSQAVRATINQVSEHLSDGVVVVSLTKGLEEKSLKRMSEVIGEVVPLKRVAVLSGPNHAEEVSQNIPSATVVASVDPVLAKMLQGLFLTPAFRVYVNKDVIGVEMAGATKNIIAIAVGVSDGLGYGDNAKAALMTRGLAEMTRLGAAAGASLMTFAGLAGVGDLIATCTSRHSRNRAVGERLAKGQSAEEAQAALGMVAEGVKSTPAVCALAERLGVEMPISRSVYSVIHDGKDPRECVEELMARGPAEEENF